MPENNLSFTIDTNESITVEDFTMSLIALNDEFKRYNSGYRELRIQKVKQGSYIVEFAISTLVKTLPLVTEANTIIDFISHLNNIKDNIKGVLRSNNKLPEKSIENTSQLIQPILNCGSNCNISINYGSHAVSFSQSDSQLIDENAPNLLKSTNKTLDEKETSHIRKKVLFFWYQTCFDKSKFNKGNKGIIENILPGTAISVIFEDDNSDAKKQMTSSRDGVDWQKIGYIVDVEILKLGDKILKYKIINNYPDESVPNIFD